MVQTSRIFSANSICDWLLGARLLIPCSPMQVKIVGRWPNLLNSEPITLMASAVTVSWFNGGVFFVLFIGKFVFDGIFP